MFICTGNYYRSRYAEIIFNHTATEYGLGLTSFSRGFQESTRTAPISPNALNRLQDRRILIDQVRYPIKLSPSDLALAQRIILMDEQEHRSMLESQFGEWSDYVEYWNIQDVEYEAPESALDRLERKVDLLISNLEMESSQPFWDQNHLQLQFS